MEVRQQILLLLSSSMPICLHSQWVATTLNTFLKYLFWIRSAMLGTFIEWFIILRLEIAVRQLNFFPHYNRTLFFLSLWRLASIVVIIRNGSCQSNAQDKVCSDRSFSNFSASRVGDQWIIWRSGILFDIFLSSKVAKQVGRGSLKPLFNYSWRATNTLEGKSGSQTNTFFAASDGKKRRK